MPELSAAPASARQEGLGVSPPADPSGCRVTRLCQALLLLVLLLLQVQNERAEVTSRASRAALPTALSDPEEGLWGALQ